MSEPLVAIMRVTTPKGGKRFGYAWIKKEEEAMARCRGALQTGEILTGVWTADWRKDPSQYKLVIGDSSIDKEGPNLDMAATLREQFLRKPSKKERRTLRKQIAAAINKVIHPAKEKKEWHPWIPQPASLTPKESA